SGGAEDGDSRARPNNRTGALLPAARLSWLRRTGRVGWSDGARAGRRQEMADEGADARGDRDLPVVAGTARHPGRDLHLLPARRLLGRVGRWMVVHLAEF